MSALFSAVLAMLSAMSLSGQGVSSPASTATAKPPAERAPETIAIDPALYESANWPAHNKGSLNARNVQGSELAVKLGGETWLTKKTDLNNKVLVLDFWAVWCPPCRAAEPKLHALQEANTDKLQVVAISGQGEDQSTVESYIGKKEDLNYTHLFDANQAIYKSLQVRAIPHVVVLSTDGVVRWQGNPHDKAFKEAVDQVVKNDPMIKAKFAG
jgi:thiol-disulfide isomerase/thioredoxin